MYQKPQGNHMKSLLPLLQNDERLSYVAPYTAPERPGYHFDHVRVPSQAIPFGPNILSSSPLSKLSGHVRKYAFYLTD